MKQIIYHHLHLANGTVSIKLFEFFEGTLNRL